MRTILETISLVLNLEFFYNFLRNNLCSQHLIKSELYSVADNPVLLLVMHSYKLKKQIFFLDMHEYYLLDCHKIHRASFS